MEQEFWFYAENGESKGPITKEYLVALLRTLPPDTLVWYKELPAWTPANQVAELCAAMLPPPLPTMPPPLPPPLPAIQSGEPGESAAAQWQHEQIPQHAQDLSSPQINQTSQPFANLNQAASHQSTSQFQELNATPSAGSSPPIVGADRPQPSPSNEQQSSQPQGRIFTGTGGNPWKNPRSTQQSSEKPGANKWAAQQSSSSTYPTFNGIAPKSGVVLWSACYYRVFVKPHEIYFIWSGEPELPPSKVTPETAAARVAFGIVGEIVARELQHDPYEPKSTRAKDNRRRQMMIDASPLEALIPDNADNFRAAFNDVQQLVIGPRSQTLANCFRERKYEMENGMIVGEHKAVLLLKHKTKGKVEMGLLTDDDVRTAMRELPKVFGGTCKIEIEWSDRERKFLKKRT
jgi:hypothetical protein